MITPDTARALADREAGPVAPPAYDCCGCTTGAEVSAPDGLCADCKPRFANAGEHLRGCPCAECVWFWEVDARQAHRRHAVIDMEPAGCRALPTIGGLR